MERAAPPRLGGMRVALADAACPQRAQGLRSAENGRSTTLPRFMDGSEEVKRDSN